MSKLIQFLLDFQHSCSVVWFYSEFINHRDTEDTEVAQKKSAIETFVQSRYRP